MMPATQEETALKKLRRLFEEGELPTGEFLSQRQLAARVDTSVITLRSCLRRLEHEGLIENVPKWGVRIPEDSEADIRDRYFLRTLLEEGALREMLPRLTAEMRQTLLTLAEACDQTGTLTAEDARHYADAHLRFHLYIAECSGHPLLLTQLSNLLSRRNMLRNARRGWLSGGTEPDNHRTLTQAILSGDEEAAVRALHVHIEQGLEQELRALRREQVEKE